MSGTSEKPEVKEPVALAATDFEADQVDVLVRRVTLIFTNLHCKNQIFRIQ